jgi:ABC-type sugar transport system permease subunit
MSPPPPNSSRTAWLFLAPFLLCTLLFVVYPIFALAILSLQHTYGPKTYVFVGLRTFHSLMEDRLFWTALRNTCLIAGGSLLTQVPVALYLALLLNDASLRFRTFFRVVIFSPSLMGLAYVGVLFGPIFAKNTGLLDIALHRCCLLDIEFPWTERFVILSLLIAGLWMNTGIYMVYFVAALQGIPSVLLDAAAVDGASRWNIFRHVIVPGIKPVSAFVMFLCLISAFQLFELPYILLNFGGGPDNRGLTLVMYLYQTGFESGDLGYANVIAWSVSFILIALAVGQQIVSRTYERV